MLRLGVWGELAVAAIALRDGSRRLAPVRQRCCLCGTRFCSSTLGSIPEPDFASERDRSIDARIGQQECIESAHETSDPVMAKREARRDAHEPACLPTAAQFISEQRPEVSQVSRDDRALLSRERREVNAIGAPPQVRPLPDGNDVVAALAELARDLGR